MQCNCPQCDCSQFKLHCPSGKDGKVCAFVFIFCLIQIHFLLTLSFNAVISETELFTFEFSIFPEKCGFMEQNAKAELIMCWKHFLQIFMRYLYLFCVLKKYSQRQIDWLLFLGKCQKKNGILTITLCCEEEKEDTREG